MNKVILGIVLGGILGVFDGLTALVSAPETAPQIVGIVIGSTIKGLVAGLLIGWFARKVDNLWLGLAFGLVVGGFFAWLVTLGGPYLWEIVVPGSIVGLIVGFATQRFGAGAAGRATAVALLAVVLAAAAPPAAAAGADAHAAFDTLKGLAGHWTEKAGTAMTSEVVYAWSPAVRWSWSACYPGTDYEMISMYHMDGDDLVMVHYCESGNQPRLELVSTADGVLTFDFVGGSNVDPAQDAHIHGARIRLAEDGTLHEAWIGYAGGEKKDEMVMELTRGAQ